MFKEKMLGCDLANNLYYNRIAGLVCGKEIFCKLNSVCGKKEKKVYVLVSFDCDRDADTNVLLSLAELLKKYGVLCGLATTASLVEKNPDIYKTFFSYGHELLNHGYSLHTATTNRKEIYSTFFYNDVEWEFIEQEILKAQKIYHDFLGIYARGFRVPHFGTFQNKEKIQGLYKILAKHGIQYSSSLMTFPMNQFGFDFIIDDNMIEIPLSNQVHLPYSVVDSHTLIHTPSRLHLKNRFYKAFSKMLDTAIEADGTMFINFYADPSQVVYEKQFEDAIAYAKSKGNTVEFMTYNTFINSVIKNKE